MLKLLLRDDPVMVRVEDMHPVANGQLDVVQLLLNVLEHLAHSVVKTLRDRVRCVIVSGGRRLDLHATI